MNINFRKIKINKINLKDKISYTVSKIKSLKSITK